MENNKLTQRLLAEGWTEDQTPPGCRPWNSFHGGWTYSYQAVKDWVFETPCGLLVKRGEMGHSGTMYYNGIEWTEENDCATIICPYYDRQERCELVHPLLEDNWAGCHYERLKFCNVHHTDKPYDYETSAQKVRDLAEAEQDRLWGEFAARHRGRVCKHHSSYNRRTKTWSIQYDPQMCVRMNCRRCSILGKDLDTRRGNVFYDQRTTWVSPGEGLLPEVRHVSVRKGIKLLDKTTSLTICEAIAKYCRRDIEERIRSNRHWDMYFDPSLKIDILNLRAGRTDTRDILQDLEDAAAGVTISHDADEKRLAAEQKRQRKKASYEAKLRRLERLVLEKGDEAMAHEMAQAVKFLGRDRVEDLLRQRDREEKPEQLEMDLTGPAPGKE